MAEIVTFRVAPGYFESEMVRATSHLCRGSALTITAISQASRPVLTSAIRETEDALFHMLRADGVSNADRVLFHFLSERRAQRTD